jgi:hypothetical protein
VSGINLFLKNQEICQIMTVLWNKLFANIQLAKLNFVQTFLPVGFSWFIICG